MKRWKRSELPVRGLGAWVWYLSQCGGVEGVKHWAEQLGLEWVAIKSSDGSTFGDEHDPHIFGHQFQEAVRPLKAAGFQVLSWSYNRLGDPQTKANRALWALQLGADGHIFDVESECEGKADQADDLGRIVREFAPDAFLAYAPHAAIGYHMALPYLAFSTFCDAVMPQYYTLTLGTGENWPFSRLFHQWRTFGGHWRRRGSRRGLMRYPHLVPVVGAYIPERWKDRPRDEALADVAASVRRFGPLARQRHLVGASFWRLDTIEGPVEAAVREMRL